MCTRLIIYPYKVILTWFRPIPKPKTETIGLKGPTGQWPPFSHGKEYYSISVIEGWPPLVFYLPGSQVTCVSNRAEGANWTKSLVFIHSNVFFRNGHFEEGAIFLSHWKWPHQLGLRRSTRWLKNFIGTSNFLLSYLRTKNPPGCGGQLHLPVHIPVSGWDTSLWKYT